jgi:hypothetical protein
MVEVRTDIHEEKRKKTCIDSCIDVSKMWEDSCLQLYKPWFESTEALFKMAFDLSKDAAPETYKEFYDEWVKTSRNSFGIESNKIYSTWIAELEDNSRATCEVLQGEIVPAKYLEVYGMWVKSYGKMLNDLLTLPFRQNMKFIFEKIKGTSDIY